MPRLALAALAFATVAEIAAANEFEPAMQSFLEREISTWAANPVLIQAIREQNARTAGLSQADIDAMDQTWRAEIGTSERPTIVPVLENPAAEFLRGRVDSAGGAITEIFVMDARGLNVAASAVTSDYWQGDEAKFTRTYPVGPGATHFGEVELDESSQTYQGQISIALVDPESNEVIGAMTVGVNAEALF